MLLFVGRYSEILGITWVWRKGKHAYLQRIALYHNAAKHEGRRRVYERAPITIIIWMWSWAERLRTRRWLSESYTSCNNQVIITHPQFHKSKQSRIIHTNYTHHHPRGTWQRTQAIPTKRKCGHHCMCVYNYSTWCASYSASECM